MSWLARLWGRVTGAPALPDPEVALDAADEEILVAARYNAATRRGRVITNVSVQTATDLHSDLLTLPAPRDRTSAYAVALNNVLRKVGGRSGGSA